MDDIMVLDALRSDLESMYSDTKNLLQRFRKNSVKYPRVVDFFDRVMEFYLFPRMDYDTSSFEDKVKACVKTSLYGLFEEVINHHKPHEFIPGLISFLDNACLDDAYFEIRWIVSRHDPEEKLDLIIEEVEEREGAKPQIVSAGDSGSKDVEKLHHALDRLIEEEQRFVKWLNDFENNE